jgi:hypothetical protein
MHLIQAVVLVDVQDPITSPLPASSAAPQRLTASVTHVPRAPTVEPKPSCPANFVPMAKPPSSRLPALLFLPV